MTEVQCTNQPDFPSPNTLPFSSLGLLFSSCQSLLVLCTLIVACEAKGVWYGLTSTFSAVHCWMLDCCYHCSFSYVGGRSAASMLPVDPLLVLQETPTSIECSAPQSDVSVSGGYRGNSPSISTAHQEDLLVGVCQPCSVARECGPGRPSNLLKQMYIPFYPACQDFKECSISHSRPYHLASSLLPLLGSSVVSFNHHKRRSCWSGCPPAFGYTAGSRSQGAPMVG